MKALMKRWVNSGLRSVGLEVAKAGAAERKNARLRETTREAVNLYRETCVPGLPELDDNQIEMLIERCGTSLGEALYILEGIQRTWDVPGHVCEFGIAQGATSVQLAYAIRGSEKHLFLLDSFEGLSEPGEKDELIDDIFSLGSMKAYAGTMATPMDIPAARLEAIKFPRNRIHFIKQMIQVELRDLDKLPSQVAFAYFDMDLYEPTLLSLEWFDAVSSPGSIAVVDDYGFLSSGVKTAVQEFLLDKKYRFDLPIGAAGHFCLLEKL
jgi:hypothetical protein